MIHLKNDDGVFFIKLNFFVVGWNCSLRIIISAPSVLVLYSSAKRSSTKKNDFGKGLACQTD